MSTDPTIIEKLNELQAAIDQYPDPRRASSEWKQVYKLLQKTDVPPGRITSLVGMRNMEGLAEVIGQLSAPETEAPDPGAGPWLQSLVDRARELEPRRHLANRAWTA